jgi:hypothetical protein
LWHRGYKRQHQDEDHAPAQDEGEPPEPFHALNGAVGWGTSKSSELWMTKQSSPTSTGTSAITVPHAELRQLVGRAIQNRSVIEATRFDKEMYGGYEVGKFLGHSLTKIRAVPMLDYSTGTDELARHLL